MKRIFFLVAFLALTFSAIAVEPAAVPKMTASKHDFVPFIGYQILDGGTRGYDLSFNVRGIKYIPDTTVHSSDELEYNTQAPVIGIGYRYIASPMLYGELSGGVMLDKKNFTYPVLVDFGAYTQQYRVNITRSHTYFLGGDAINTYQLMSNLKAGIRAGGGYVWRTVKATSDFPTSQGTGTLKAFDADKLYKVRGGVELSFYHDEVLMLEGALIYTRYIPTDSEKSSYGGLGWQFAIFPVWLGN